MIKEEWKNLLHNKLLLIVVIAIILIPIIYAGLFLKSMWDPYGTLDQLPVAVVNNDQPVTYESKVLTIGDDLVEKLEEDGSLQFNFVNADVAEAGLKNGTYYMVITIPENFSECASTLMDDEPKKMQLDYATNPGTNYIASKLSSTALDKIKTSVAEKVTKVYAETVFDQFGTIGDGMDDAADGARELEDGIVKAADGSNDLKDGISDASDGVDKINKNLKKLASSTITFKDGAETLEKGIADYTDGAVKIANGVTQLNDGVGQLTDKVPELVVGTQKLNTGISDYVTGASQLNEKMPQITGGIAKLKVGSTQLSTGAQNYVDGVNAYITGTEDGVKKLAAGANQLSALQNVGSVKSAVSQMNGYFDATSEGTLAYGSALLDGGLGQLKTQVDGLASSTSAEGLKTMAGAMKSAKDMASADAVLVGNAATSIGTNAEKINAGVAAVNDGAQAVNEGIAAVNAGVQTVNTKANEVNSKIDSLNTAQSDAKSAITDAKSAIEAAISAVNDSDIDNKEAIISTLEGKKNALDTASGKISSDMTKVDTMASVASAAPVETITVDTSGYTTIAGTLSAHSQGFSQIANGIPENLDSSVITNLQTAVTQLSAGATDLNNGIKTFGSKVGELKAATSKLDEAGAGMTLLLNGFGEMLDENGTFMVGGTALQGYGTDVLNGVKAIDDGTTELQNGATQFAGGLALLNSNNTMLSSGSQEVADGAATLASGAGTLSSGVTELYDGSQQLISNNEKLVSGSSELADGSAKIQDGSQQLYDGSNELADGMTKLSDGSSDLVDGMNKLTDGSDELRTGVEDGAEEVNDVKTTDATYDMFSAPVDAEETQVTEVPNNGHAMAPYMMSVGLWVGALAFCLIYPLMKYNGKLKSGLGWWASKASVLYLVAILQGIALIGLLHGLAGFEPAEMGKTIAFACLTAVTFTSIMYFFNITLGKVGSFIMLVFMVVQLAGSAGTYPVEVSPAFVSKIHAFVPFTYTVNAFRSTIAGGESIMGSVQVMVVLFIIFSLLTILSFTIKAKRKKENKFILFDWLEEKGLA